jgi:hypothetical protein
MNLLAGGEQRTTMERRTIFAMYEHVRKGMRGIGRTTGSAPAQKFAKKTQNIVNNTRIILAINNLLRYNTKHD